MFNFTSERKNSLYNVLCAMAESLKCKFYYWEYGKTIKTNVTAEIIDLTEMIAVLEQQFNIGAAINDLLNEGKPFIVERNNINVTGIQILNDSNSAIGFLITIAVIERNVAAEDDVVAILEKAPLACWLRNDNLDLIYCNNRYQELIGDQQEITKRNVAIASKAVALNTVVTNDIDINLNNKHCSLEITEIPMKDGSTVGYAIEMTEKMEFYNKYVDHIKASYGFFESCYSAVAIYNAQKKLVFYNNAFMNMWSLEAPWLDSRPHHADILNKMRANRKIPEQMHFPNFQEQQLSLFSLRLEIPYTDFWHLPDGRTIHLVVVPYAEGGLLFSYTDHTRQLEIERAYNTLVVVRRETLENIKESVSVFAENGKLKLYNKNYAMMWDLSEEYLNAEPSMRDILNHMKKKCSEEAWNEMSRISIIQLNNRMRDQLRIDFIHDGRIVDMYITPLRDGCLLFTYSDVTDSIKLERSLREINKNVMESERSKSAFFENISYELRSPLTSIYGYAEILNKYYASNMSTEQLLYLQRIISESRKLMSLVNDMLFAASIDDNKESGPTSCINLAQLIREGIQDAKNDPNNNSIQIETRLDDDLILNDSDINAANLKQVISKVISVSCMDADCSLHICLEAENGVPTVHFQHCGCYAKPIYMQRQEITLCIIRRLANTSSSKLEVITEGNRYKGAKLIFTHSKIAQENQ